EDTEAFETDESVPTPPSPRPRRDRISVRLEPPMLASMEARIAEYAAAPTPPSPSPSPLTPLSSPLPQISSPPLPLPSPPTHNSPTYAKATLGYKAAEIRLRAASPLPLPAPSSPLLPPVTGHKEHVLEADVSPRKRLCLTSPTYRFGIEESSATAAARQLGSSMARRANYSFVDTVDSSIRAVKERAIAAVRVVNLRVSYQALARSEAYNRALEARIATIETQLYLLEWQRQDADDHTTRAMMRIHVLGDTECINTLEDTSSSV
nr:hypothetical protein [Tanacetum cinerariifolium]